MTSFAVNYNWTPEMIARDKELKEKFGPSAHITPAKTTAGLSQYLLSKDTVTLNNSDKKNNKTKNLLWAAGGLVLTAASLYLFRGKIKNIVSKFANNSSAAVENNISERVLSNGKKVQKIVENTEDGAKKVIMNVFDETGNLVLKKEKVITRSVNSANGKQHINIKNSYTSPDIATITFDGLPVQFNKNMSIDTNKYYNSKGSLLFKTEMLKDGCVPVKERIAYDINGEAKLATLTYYDLKSGFRRNRITFENPFTQAAAETSNKFSPKGTALKPQKA